MYEVDGDQHVEWATNYEWIYTIGITPKGEFAIMMRKHETRETTTMSPYFIDDGWSSAEAVPLASFDDIAVNFDFSGYGEWHPGRFWGKTDYLGPGSSRPSDLRITRLFMKGYGLLGRLAEPTTGLHRLIIPV